MRPFVDLNHDFNFVFIFVINEFRIHTNIQITFLLIKKVDPFDVFFKIFFLEGSGKKPFFLVCFHKFPEFFVLERLGPFERDLANLEFFSFIDLHCHNGFFGLRVYIDCGLDIDKTKPFVRIKLSDLAFAFFNSLTIQDLPFDYI